MGTRRAKVVTERDDLATEMRQSALLLGLALLVTGLTAAAGQTLLALLA